MELSIIHMPYIMKMTAKSNLVQKGFVFLGIFAGIIAATQADNIFSLLPTSPAGQPIGGTLSGKLANIIGTCAGNTFLKGFDANLDKICVHSDGVFTGTADPYILDKTGYPENPPTGEHALGKFGTYFKNLIGTCPGSSIVKGFASDGYRLCVEIGNPSEHPAHTATGAQEIDWPSSPDNKNSGGIFQSFFDKMFISCPGTRIIKGFDTDRSPICVEAPIDGVCGTSNGSGATETAPSENLCSTGQSSGAITQTGTTNPWRWTCSGINNGATVNCSEPKKALYNTSVLTGQGGNGACGWYPSISSGTPYGCTCMTGEDTDSSTCTANSFMTHGNNHWNCVYTCVLKPLN